MSIAFRYYKNKDDAMAITNQSFHKTLTGLKSFLEENNTTAYKPWISRIMINAIIDEYRKEKKKKEIFDENELENPDIMINDAHFNEVEEAIEAEELQSMINTLPDLQQKVFNLFVIDGYKHNEISEMLTISVGNSKWNLSTARKELRRLINQVTISI